MAVIEKDGDREPTQAPTPEASAAPAGAGGEQDGPAAPEEGPDPPADTASPDDVDAGDPAEEPPAEAAPREPEAGSSADGAAREDEAAAKQRPARTKMSRSRQMKLASLFRAFRSGRPMEGTVEGAIKGGYEIKLGKVRAFCPHSQIDLQRAEDASEHVGKRYTFRITQLRRGGDDIVVSRRAILEDERKDEAKAVRATLIEGAVMQGRVAGIAEFGAFIDLGAGVMGLVHVSELSHNRVSRVSDAVKVGDLLNVKILKLDDRSKRISLSARQAQEDPWVDVAQRFTVGGVYAGEIRRITDFGAFVQLAPGVEALAPASEFPPSSPDWREGLDAGQTRDWLVLSVDADQHRISVTPPVEGTSLEGLPALEVGKSAEGRVQRVEKFGVFVWLGPGRVGLIPGAWSGTPRGEDLARRFSIGDPIQVDVVEVSEEGKRIRLAKTGVKIAQEAPGGPGPRRAPGARTEGREAAREEAVRPGQDSKAGAFGTILADKLRAALGRREDEDGS